MTGSGTEAPSTAPEGGGNDRQPVAWPVAAGVLLLGVLVVLAVLLVVRRSDQPVTAPSESVAPGVRTLATSQAAPTAVQAAQVAPTALARPTDMPAATAQPAPQALSTPSVASLGQAPAQPPAMPGQATAQSQGAQAQLDRPETDPTVSVAMVMVNGTPQILGRGTPLPTAQAAEWWNDVRTVPPALTQEVQQAYSRFWDVRSQAFLDANPDALPQVMDGVALQNDLAALRELQVQHRAQLMEISHNIRVLHASPDEAAIEDDYVAHVVNVDAETKEPVETSPRATWQFVYRMRKINGIWKVTDGVRLVDA